MRLDHSYIDLPSPSSWLRGNLHAHTTRTDGVLSPQEAIDKYAALGYDFLALSDHDLLTAAPDYAQWRGHNLIFLPGNEITANGPHLLHIGARERIEPDPDRRALVRQAVSSGGFILANHPNWGRDFSHFAQPDLENWSDDGLLGLEIFNGTIGRLHGTSYATDRWDRLLTTGRRAWGFAHDDSHKAEEDIGLGWIHVGAREKTPAAIEAAIRAGQFYASTGVTLTAIEVDENRITVAADNADRMIASYDHGRRLAVVDGNRIQISIPEGASYVRVEAWGRGEQFAWTQPFWVIR